MSFEPNMPAVHFVHRHWVKVWNGHDGVGMKALFHEDGTYTDPFAGTIPSSEMPAMIARIHALVPDFVFEVVGAVTEAQVEGRRTLALQWLMRGKQARTGQTIALPGVDFLEFEGGLIRRANTYFDMAELQRQSGPAPRS
jgi:steroid delta-isomerase-like uncharacterized protein